MRLIDADELLSELKPITYEMEQNTVTIADMSNIMRNWVCRQPTVPTYGQWIRVEEEKPDTGQYVLVNHKDGVMQCAQYLISGYDDRELWMLDHYYKEQSEITHWMPLPEPPKEVMKDGKDD